MGVHYWSNPWHKFGVHDGSMKLFSVSAYDLTEKGGFLYPTFSLRLSTNLKRNPLKAWVILGSHNLEAFPFAPIGVPLLSLISRWLTRLRLLNWMPHIW